MLWFLNKKKTFNDSQKISRHEIIKRSRILFIDDDKEITLAEFLRGQGFSIDHDREGNDLTKYNSGLYDLIVLDYHGVGSNLGSKHGLELIRNFTRNSNIARIIAYTSRSLSANEADFFKLAHAVLPKDLGLADSMELIEDQLNLCYDKNLIFDSLIKEMGIKEESKINEIKTKIIETVESKNKDGAEKYIKETLKFSANKSIDMLLGKLF